jgi:hypothetical protein
VDQVKLNVFYLVETLYGIFIGSTRVLCLMLELIFMFISRTRKLVYRHPRFP